MISAMNSVRIERDVVLSPSILLMDHNHAFEDINVPICDQGITEGGTIRIEEGCWIGFGTTIVSSRGDLVIGKNSVVGANCVLTRSVPPFSLVTGNPGKVVKQFDGAAERGLAEPARRELHPSSRTDLRPQCSCPQGFMDPNSK